VQSNQEMLFRNGRLCGREIPEASDSGARMTLFYPGASTAETRRPVHRNVTLSCGEQGYVAANRTCSPQLNLNLPQRNVVHRRLRLICRSFDLFTATQGEVAATWACSPQPWVDLPRPQLVQCNARLFCRNVGLFTAKRGCFATTSVVHCNVDPFCRRLGLFTATRSCFAATSTCSSPLEVVWP
jgi:hypothetical protein